MATPHYKVNEKTKTVIADISAITDQEKKEIQTLIDFGYNFKRATTTNKKSNAMKGINSDWFKERLSTEDYEKFKADVKAKNFFKARNEWLPKVKA